MKTNYIQLIKIVCLSVGLTSGANRATSKGKTTTTLQQVAKKVASDPTTAAATAAAGAKRMVNSFMGSGTPSAVSDATVAPPASVPQASMTREELEQRLKRASDTLTESMKTVEELKQQLEDMQDQTGQQDLSGYKQKIDNEEDDVQEVKSELEALKAKEIELTEKLRVEVAELDAATAEYEKVSAATIQQSNNQLAAIAQKLEALPVNKIL